MRSRGTGGETEILSSDGKPESTNPRGIPRSDLLEDIFGVGWGPGTLPESLISSMPDPILNSRHKDSLLLTSQVYSTGPVPPAAPPCFHTDSEDVAGDTGLRNARPVPRHPRNSLPMTSSS